MKEMQCEELICETIFVSVDKVIDCLFIIISSFLTALSPNSGGGLESPPTAPHHHHHTNEGPANLKEMQCEELICDTIFVGVDKVMMIIE